MPGRRTNLYERYELDEVLGKGGMGVVYRARDTLMDREVALKTLLDIDNPLTLELFYKECGVLAGMVHPNIINVYDVGEFEDNGVKKPFFVMPLLPGATLDKLIRDPKPSFSLETMIEIISQACRGLQAAHEMGLVHRDIKPSNIFVMEDNSVKLIDFGIARSATMNSMTSMKGTLSYMAPEQLQLKAPTALSDQYAMAVVCYEALTRRRPFQGTTETQLVDAILRQTAPPISDINPNVRFAVSQVVHKAMAKQPFHRFLSVREFSDALTRAARAETLEYFDSAKIKPRLERANAAFESADYEFANEVLSELESEGYLEQEITLLRRRLDQSMRQARVRRLLDSANRYAEAQEFPLALRKIQEALEIDAENADAIAMKNRVEKGRREKKIDEWLQLARQHIENQSFAQAHDALEQALKLKPNETEALRLQAEISRREADITKAREEKARIYESAVQAWERGDVTSALSRLDQLISLDREAPDTDSGRSGTYQSFYNQVRSEHDNLKNSYEEARRQLNAENFAGAMAICKQYLARYPSHTLFQALQFDIDERQRQKLSALIAETDRRVDQEPDLEVRVAILEEAARQYPEEKHFQSSLRLVKDKRDLVQSIVAKAQLYEDRQQFNEALDQWQIIRSIHAGYPGLEFEIERVEKNRDTQQRLSAKARVIETIDRHIETADYDRATRSLDEATRDFPNDPDFPELDKLIRKSQERSAQAQELFARARELGEANQVDECLSLLRQAHQIDSRNPVIRTVLINTLLDRAGQLVSHYYAAAEPILREVLDLEPNQAAAQSLLSQVADRKREEFVTQCTSQARKLQVDGYLEEALVEARRGLDAYPRDKLLQQLQSTLLRTLGLPEIVLPEETGEQRLPSPAAPTRLEAAAPPSWGEQETAALNAVQARAVPPPVSGEDPTVGLFETKTLPQAAPVPPPPGASTFVPPPPAPADTIPPPPAEEEASIPYEYADEYAEPPAVPPPPPPPPVSPRAPFPWKIIAGAAGGVFLIVILTVFLTHRRPKQEAPPPAGANRVSVQASVPQAAILIDDRPCGAGTCQLDLAPGPHRAEARMDGYAPAFATFEIPAGATGATPVTLEMAPRLSAVVIATNLNQATVAVDQGAEQPLQNGEIQLPELPAGQRSIRFKAEGNQAVLSITAAPAAAPRIDLPIQQQSLTATIVSGLGASAKVFTTLQNAEATLDGKPAGKVQSTGLDLTKLTPGSHEIVVTSAQASPQRVVFDSGPVPLMAVFLGAERNLGMLLILTGQDDVAVYVNGEKYKRSTLKGRLILNLAPKSYKIRVEKEGFQPVAEQSVEIKKGEEARVDFNLVRQPLSGTLVVQKAPAGAEVLIDGTPAGTVHPDGTLPIVALKPGSHSLTIRKESFKPLTRDINVPGGQQTFVEGTLQLAAGSVKIAIAPADVHPALSWKRDGEESSQAFTENPVSLPEGNYTIAGRVPGYEDARTTAKVVAGREAAAVLVFKKIAAKKAAAAIVQGFTLSDVEKGGGWENENGALTRTGGNVVVIPVGQTAGAYAFTAMMPKGKHLDWFVNYVDAKNNVSYELSSDTLARTEYVDGRKQNAAKSKVQVKLDQSIQVTIALTADSIVTGIQQQQVDRFVHEGPALSPGTSFERGKFAFRIPGKDRMALSAFTFTPK